MSARPCGEREAARRAQGSAASERPRGEHEARAARGARSARHAQRALADEIFSACRVRTTRRSSASARPRRARGSAPRRAPSVSVSDLPLE